jgi:[ribosomal protein S5]-alanine N-acetyltransferase
MKIETERLLLRELNADDAPFILGLLNEPSFLQYIGDKGVRTVADAREYIAEGPVASYAAHGHGLYHVALKETLEPIGMCGILRRPTLDSPDIGFAYLPAYWGRGYALEAAHAVLEHARDALGVTDVVAIASMDNAPSAKLLNKLGLSFTRVIESADGSPVGLFTRASAE